MPSENPGLKASRCAAARSTRACHSSALLSESVFGETLNCMRILLVLAAPQAEAWAVSNAMLAQFGLGLAEIAEGLLSGFARAEVERHDPLALSHKGEGK